MAYDALGRLRSKAYPDGTSLIPVTIRGISLQGRLSQVIDLSGTQVFSYDHLGRLIQKKRTIGSSDSQRK